MQDLRVNLLALRLWLSLRLRSLLEWLDPPAPKEDERPAYLGKCERVIWTEPGDAEAKTHVTRSCSIAEAVAMQRAAGARHGHYYVNDREALEDFLVIHWADVQNLDWSKLD